jgi:hypothetical protein
LKNHRGDCSIAPGFSTMPRRLFLIILATLLFSQHASPATGGVIQGIIADDVGGPLPAARVSIQRADRSLVRSTESGGMGFYRFDELPVGTYTLTASHPGFASASARVSVASGKETTLSLQLHH